MKGLTETLMDAELDFLNIANLLRCFSHWDILVNICCQIIC